MEALLEYIEENIEWSKSQLDPEARMSCFPTEYKKFLTERIDQYRSKHYALNNIYKLEKNREERLIHQELIQIFIDEDLKRLQKLTYKSSANDLTSIKQVPIQNFYVGKLRKTGDKFTGKCPFHDDSSASFFIYPTNTWYCFGCSEGGDVIAFIMKRDNCDFKTALEMLRA